MKRGHKCGDLFCFHGSFNEKADAVRKEQSTPGAFIKFAATRRGFRYLVLTRKARKQQLAKRRKR